MARTLLVLAALLSTTAFLPVSAADDVCALDGPLGFCIHVPSDPDEIVSVQPPVYCLHEGGVEPCPPQDP